MMDPYMVRRKKKEEIATSATMELTETLVTAEYKIVYLR